MKKVEELNLIKTIDNLAKEKEQKSQLEGSIKKASDFIKQKFKELDIEEYSTDEFKAYIRRSNKIEMDEEQLIEILRQNLSTFGCDKVIKTKQYVDYDALETMIYQGVISADKLEPAQSVKTIISLYTKAVKKGEENE